MQSGLGAHPHGEMLTDDRDPALLGLDTEKF